MRYLARSAIWVSLLLLPAVQRAEATTITFENESVGPFAASVNDSGYTLTPLTGSLVIADNGNPDHDLEADLSNPPPPLTTVLNNEVQFARTDGSIFQLSAFDLGLRADGSVDFNGTVVQAYLNGVLVGTATFENVSVNGTYDWTTENSSSTLNSLVGTVFDTDTDQLVFTLPAFYPVMDNPAAAALDNVVFNDNGTASLPEPSAMVLLLSGLLGVGFIKRRS